MGGIICVALGDPVKRFKRILLFGFILLALAGAGYAIYGYVTRQIMLRVAVLSEDGEDARLINAMNRWLVANNRHTRLRTVVMPSPETALEAVRTHQADVASVRADIPIPADLASELVLYKEPALLVGLPQSGVTSWQNLRGKTIGVVGQTATEDRLLAALLRLNGVADARLVKIPSDAIEREMAARRIHALAYVGPLSGQGLNEFRLAKPLRTLKGELKLLELDNAEAFAAQDKRYEDFDIPASSLRAIPPLPAEASSTLAVSRHLIGRKSVSSFSVSRFLTDALDAKRGILADFPLASQINAPDTEKQATVAVHKGAVAYFAEEQINIWEVAAEWIFAAPIIVGAVGTALLWLYRLVWPPDRPTVRELLGDIIALRKAADSARDIEAVAELERQHEDLFERLENVVIHGEANDTEAAMLMASSDFNGQKLAALREALAAGDDAA